MGITINVRETPAAAILQVSGRIALGSPGPSIQDRVRDLIQSNHKKILLDLGGVTYLDSSGLGQLVGSYATAVSHGGAIKLTNLNKRVYDLMQITKLYTVFSIYADEAEALKSFEAESVSVPA